MENASKALIMAGGVLISLLIIGILVFFFNNLSNLKGIESSNEKVMQAAEFNKQYDVYARDVYGSELLSIANKIEDYNKRESENKGYEEIKLEVKINTNIDNEFFIKGTYDSAKIEKKIEELKKKIENIGNISITRKDETKPKASRKVSQLATMRTKDIEDLGFIEEQYKEMVTNYNTYKTLLTEIKAKQFKYVGFEYDKYNGRITKMKYSI